MKGLGLSRLKDLVKYNFPKKDKTGLTGFTTDMKQHSHNFILSILFILSD